MVSTKLYPLYEEKYFSYVVDVAGVSLQLNFIWNTRTEHYHLSAYLPDKTAIIEGYKLVVDGFVLTSAMFQYGLRGGFLLSPKNDLIEDNDTNRENMYKNYIFSYVE